MELNSLRIVVAKQHGHRFFVLKTNIVAMSSRTCANHCDRNMNAENFFLHALVFFVIFTDFFVGWQDIRRSITRIKCYYNECHNMLEVKG